MKNSLIFFFLSAVVFFLVYTIQNFIINNLKEDLFFDIWKVNLFNFLLVIFLFCVVYMVNKLKKEYIGFSFLVASTIQMLLCVIFLLPMIFSTKTQKEIDVLIFMSSYFVGLVLSVIRTINLLK